MFLRPRLNLGRPKSGKIEIGAPVNFGVTGHLISTDVPPNGKTWFFSGWMRAEQAATAQTLLTANGPLRGITVRNNPAGTALEIIGYNSASTIVAFSGTSPSHIADDDWHHLAVSFDLADTLKRHVFFDGVELVGTWTTYTDTDIQWDNQEVLLGYSFAFSEHWDGDMADIQLDNRYEDLSLTIGNYISGSAPGSTPVNLPLTNQLVSLFGQVNNWHVNKGSIVGFDELGTALSLGFRPVQLGDVEAWDANIPWDDNYLWT